MKMRNVKNDKNGHALWKRWGQKGIFIIGLIKQNKEKIRKYKMSKEGSMLCMCVGKVKGNCGNP